MAEQTKERLNKFFIANYLLMVLSLCAYLTACKVGNPLVWFFLLAALFCYAFFYLIPAGLLIGITELLVGRTGAVKYLFGRAALYTIAIAAMSATQLFIFVDHAIYKLYSFHMNGFVWNIIFTKGGIDSLAAGSSAMIAFVLIIAAIIAVEIFLLLFVAKLQWRFMQGGFFRMAQRFKLKYVIIAVLFGAQGVVYGFSSFKAYSPVIVNAYVFPYYQPVTSQGLFKKLGFKPARTSGITLKNQESLRLSYPLKELQLRQDRPKYNIVWLTAESLSAPMLTEEIMPATWEFSKKSCRFNQHYSGGNGTRMAVFSMFYGLYGNYWFNFLAEQKPPVLMDLLRSDNYQIDLFTSAAFTYPEFDKTVFSYAPKEHMREGACPQGWQSDRENVSMILDCVEKRDINKPFMIFMFFESPHAPYNFPPESVIRPDYLKNFNYATTDIAANIVAIKDRYINSCRHLDTQIQRILACLEEKKLLDSTIVIITGDHGQEFMEHGKWGHNSDYTQQQTRVPLVLWVPGQKPMQVDRMTSHLDLPATVLNQLGVMNPPSDYSLGYDLLGQQERQFSVVADWDSLCYIDDDCKIILPVKGGAFNTNKITTKDDVLIENHDATLSQKRDKLLGVLKESARFVSGGK